MTDERLTPWVLFARLANLAHRGRVSSVHCESRPGGLTLHCEPREPLNLQDVEPLEEAEALSMMWAERHIQHPTIHPVVPCPTCDIDAHQPCKPTHLGEREPGRWQHPAREAETCEQVGVHPHAHRTAQRWLSKLAITPTIRQMDILATSVMALLDARRSNLPDLTGSYPAVRSLWERGVIDHDEARLMLGLPDEDQLHHLTVAKNTTLDAWGVLLSCGRGVQDDATYRECLIRSRGDAERRFLDATERLFADAALMRGYRASEIRSVIMLVSGACGAVIRVHADYYHLACGLAVGHAGAHRRGGRTWE